LLIPHRPWCTNHSTLPHYALTSVKSDRLLSKSSSINSMVYVRGNPLDYDT